MYRHPATRLRVAAAKIHLYLGLLFGLIYAVVGLSGSALVVIDPLMELEFGGLLQAPVKASSGGTAPVDLWLENARRNSPELQGVDMVLAPNTAPFRHDTPLVLGFSPEEPRRPGWTVAVIDPASNDLRRTFHNLDSWALLSTSLHVMLAMPAFGNTLVAGSAIWLLLTLLSGVYLWWPRSASTLRRQARLNTSLRGAPFWRNLHVCIATYFMLLLLIMSVTGIYLIRPQWVTPLIDVFTPATGLSPAAFVSSPAGTCTSRTSPEEALQLARSRFPGQHFGAIMIGPDPDRPYKLTMRTGQDGDQRYGDTSVIVDRHCPRILAARGGADLAPGQRLTRSMRPLHGALNLGEVGRWIVFCSGLAVPALLVTGFAYWLLRNVRSRRRPGKESQGA